ncbi:hypothetical protein [Kitasatospora purpeofusca]|uniref:endonuclease toxin domain-containing protein n=1 Tax=Kitasatospora purpeofusca TaxID=67352 RepID=UPI003F4AF04E
MKRIPADEDKMGFDNLRAGSLTWDHFEPDSGIAISLKSMDTSLKTINNPGAFLTRLKSVVDDAAGYNGDQRPAYNGGVDPSGRICPNQGRGSGIRRIQGIEEG